MWPFRSPEDARLIAALSGGDVFSTSAPDEQDLTALFARAERHGLAGVLRDRCAARGAALPHGLARAIDAREIARSADHAAHLAMLDAIDAEASRFGVRVVALKGPLLAERLYPRPSARTSTDIDLLVIPSDLGRAEQALRRVGYLPWEGAREEHFRRRGHHLHFVHPRAPGVELHFHAFRGFGRVLPSEPLVRRSTPFERRASLSVLSAEDELLFLGVHAAGHRFMKLGWLYDLRLLVDRLERVQVERAHAVASEYGFARPFVLALERVGDVFAPAIVSGPSGLRFALARRIAEEPDQAAARTATRLAFTLSLCAGWRAAGRYLFDAALSRADAYRHGGTP